MNKLCPNCNGKGFTTKPMEQGTFYARCTKCNGKGNIEVSQTLWDKVQKHLTPEILADFFRSICIDASGCEYCSLWRECSKMNKDHPPLQKDWVEWLNKPVED